MGSPRRQALSQGKTDVPNQFVQQVASGPYSPPSANAVIVSPIDTREAGLEVPCSFDKDILVNVPHSNQINITSVVPVIVNNEEYQVVDISEKETIERLDVQHQWMREEVERDVPVSVRYEAAMPRFVAVNETIVEQEVVERSVNIAPSKTVITSDVDVCEHVYNRRVPEFRLEETTLEVPMEVDVPTVRLVKNTRLVNDVSKDEVVVPHVERRQRVVSIPQVAVAEKDVELQEIHSFQKTVYKLAPTPDARCRPGDLQIISNPSAPTHRHAQWDAHLQVRRNALALEEEVLGLTRKLDDAFIQEQELESRLHRVRRERGI